MYYFKKEMPDLRELKKKYPKWAHRKDERKRRRKKSRRRRRRRKKKADTNTTEVMLVSLLQQLLMGPTTLAKKHGENVQTGYMNMVTPDALAPVRSRAWMRDDEGQGGQGRRGRSRRRSCRRGRTRCPPRFPARVNQEEEPSF